MLDVLFSSRVRVKLLELFLSNPDQRYHSRELARLIGERQNAVWRELRKLEEACLLRSATRGNRKEYAIAKESPLYPNLRQLILQASERPRSQSELEGAAVAAKPSGSDIHERYTMPNCIVAHRPDYVVGEND
ncbi:MAG: winged helix-turn-helix transcriptional regulator [Chloroflexi bacterium]|nr:winged helix-turn-helix transcriptional regulator [Chloroflexota bacterium]